MRSIKTPRQAQQFLQNCWWSDSFKQIGCWEIIFTAINWVMRGQAACARMAPVFLYHRSASRPCVHWLWCWQMYTPDVTYMGPNLWAHATSGRRKSKLNAVEGKEWLLGKRSFSLYGHKSHLCLRILTEKMNSSMNWLLRVFEAASGVD